MNKLSPAEKDFFKYIDTFYVRSVSAGFHLWKKEKATKNLFRECTNNFKKFNILDVGCGWGSGIPKLCNELSDEAFLVESDISGQFLYTASRRSYFKGYQNVHFVRQNIQNGLAFRNESFDIIVASAVLEHLMEPIPVIKDLTRVLRMGGYLIVHLPSPGNIFGRLIRLVDRYISGGRLRWFALEDTPPESTLEEVFKEHGALGHVSELSYSEWLRLFGENGLKAIRLERGSGLVGEHPAIDRLYPLFALVLLLEPLLEYMPYKYLFCRDFLLLLKKER
ncbi:MAG: methyltransferase domain-containing protein [Candidatus Brocadiaceae bacterium]|nr:methyltransferase domain-containing protein [Candidatus Brocadiaceae bacterium]